MNYHASLLDDRLFDLALEEDLSKPWHDVTVSALELNLTGELCDALIVSKHASDIIVAGVDWLRYVVSRQHLHCRLTVFVKDGDRLAPGQKLLALQAPADILLMLERTLLNFLRHLCAVATLTAAFVDKTKGMHCKILDTRKTTPGMRHLEKYAVRCGGGVNHRMGLYDAIMIKDTHVDFIGGMKETLQHLKEQAPSPVILEVRDQSELEIALQFKEKIDRVLLDNMDATLLKDCIKRCHGHFETEASGNITLETIESIAKTGVDYASVGMITHSAGQVDLSMKIE